MRPLTLKSRIDIALTKSPLATDPYRWDLARLDESIHGSEVDLKVFQDLVPCQKRLADHDWSGGGVPPQDIIG